LKLLNYTLSYLSVALLAVMGVWAFIFYLNMLDEIYDSIDDGLENSKLLVINKVTSDTSLLYKTDFLESNYAIHKVDEIKARDFRDVYFDSTFYMQNEKDYEPVRILKTAFRAHDGAYYQLMVASSMVEEDDLIEDLLYSVISLYLIVMVSILLINNFLLKTLWQPFYDTLERLKHFNLDGQTKDFKTARSTVNEFNALNDTITALLERTVKTFSNQKQFIENAAHELQTPLAISINKLELLIEKNALPDIQMQELASIAKSLERLAKLNKTLLLLSKIDNRQFPDEQPVNFNELSTHVANQFSDFAEFKSVKVTIRQEGDGGRLIYPMNAELAEILLSNLLRNAITHNHEGGAVVVTIKSSLLSIVNTSDAPALDNAKVFERFYKNSSEKASTGLGLAIVKSIADYYGLRIAYTYNKAHIFSVQFNAESKR
jgi:signal transduction histidine kinase